jgi:HEAT repeat protein
VKTPALALRARLAEPDPETRRRAVLEIPSVPVPEACELLVRALADPDWRVRKEAANVAPLIEPRTAVVYAVAHVLGERDDVGLRNAAVEALVAIGPDSVPGAIDAMGRLDPDGRKLAVEVLAGAPTLAGMKALARAASDSDENVVAASAEALGRADLAGEEARELAIATLGGLLGRTETSVRAAALSSLRALEAPIAWAQLEPLFSDPLLRRNAIAAAAGNLSPRAFLLLAQGLADRSPTLAREAVVALGRSLEEAWGDDELLDIAAKTLRASASARAALRASAGGEDAAARGAAVLALGLVRDPDDVALIADALADDRIADRAEAALRLFGQDAVEPLVVAGRSAAPSLRAAAISMLPELAPSQGAPLAAVREGLSAGAPEVVAPALKSLAIVGVGADIGPIARHVTSDDARVSSAARAALAEVAMRHPDEALALLRVDPRGDGALAAAVVAGALRKGTEFLVVALTHRRADVRHAAIDALAAIGGEEAARAVSGSLADEEAVVALSAIRALGRLGRSEQLATLAATTKDATRLGTVLRALRDADPERAFAAARPLLRSPEPSIAAAAIDVVGSIASEATAHALMSAADHPDHEVTKLALGQIAKLGGERALGALAAALEHRADAVRKYAAELLGGTKLPEAESVLRSRLDRERSADVRNAIMQALAVRPGSG